MTLTKFLEHWQIVENPFRGEEARHDAVFTRVGLSGAREVSVEAAMTGVGGALSAGGGAPHRATHPDFEKILGDPGRPSSSIVFGEKGSGKTAIRLQIADRLAAYNAAHPDARVLLVAYDDLNGVLERFGRRAPAKTPLDSFKKFRLADHMDAVLAAITTRLVDALLGKPAHSSGGAGAGAVPSRDPERLDLGTALPPEPKHAPDPRRHARKQPMPFKRDLLLLQAVYDRPDDADKRTMRLRHMLRVGQPIAVSIWTALAWVGWAPAVVFLALSWRGLLNTSSAPASTERIIFLALVGLWGLLLAKRFGWDNLLLRRIARRIRRQLRTASRSERSYMRSLRQLDPAAREPSALPLTDSDEQRYGMLERARRVLAPFGYAAITIVVDRVDEPTLISGDAEVMRAVIWPLLNNKFLQQEGVGVKLLLPMELRHALFKESSAFFQEARLDKQHLVERLSWSGPMLYALCDARLNACRPHEAAPVTLLDLFAEDVTRQDVVEALDQMHQPRDAFKLVYHCIAEHCALMTGAEGPWRIPRHVLEMVKKQQVDRVQQLYRGIRPA